MKPIISLLILSGGGSAFALDLGRIMPLGDSLTYGAGSDGGYRLPLANALLSEGDTFSLVGPWNANSPGMSDQYAYRAGFGGASVPNVTYGDSHTGDGTAAQWTVAAQPDTVLLMAGTNAVSYTTESIRADMDTLLDSIYAAKPNVKIVLSAIPKVVANDRTAYNAFVNGVYQTIYNDRKAAGQNIWLVDNFTAIDQSNDFIADGIHLNASGYAKVANGFLRRPSCGRGPGAFGLRPDRSWRLRSPSPPDAASGVTGFDRRP